MDSTFNHVMLRCHAALPLALNKSRRALLVLAALLSGTASIAQQFVRTPDLPSAATYSFGCAWGDYDNDGFIDLAVANGGERGAEPLNLYRNQGDGSFTPTTMAEVGLAVGEAREWVCVSWADVNNDGHLDLLASAGWNTPSYDRLYLNGTAGTFTAPSAGDLTTLIHYYTGGIVPVDYDLDGRIDLFTGCAWKSVGMYNRLYRGAGDGTFAWRSQSPISTASFDANSAVWADYDNDGDPDLFVANFTSRPDYFYRNDRNGNFTRVTSGLLVNSSGNTWCPSWGDYDNDGDLDLVLTKGGAPVLLRNDRGVFSLGPTLPASASAGAPLWLDYDNDGHLDLFFVHGQGGSRRNVLCHNNGDETFTEQEDAITADYGGWCTAATGDYDNDGFMDLFVTASTGLNALYRNLTNANHWIKFRLKGTRSNASAIGAKVRVQAQIGGTNTWQMREISGGTYAQDDPRPNFGLGEATTVSAVRVEWPSGVVQEFSQLAIDRIHTVVEPKLAGRFVPSGAFEVTFTGDSLRAYALDASGDLANWTNLTNFTHGSATYIDSAAGSGQRFYRLR